MISKIAPLLIQHHVIIDDYVIALNGYKKYEFKDNGHGREHCIRLTIKNCKYIFSQEQDAENRYFSNKKGFWMVKDESKRFCYGSDRSSLITCLC